MMMILFVSPLLLTAVQTFLAILFAAYLYWKWKYLYWKKRGMPSTNPTFPFGSISFSSIKFPGTRLQEIYNELKSAGQKHGGIYQIITPVYLMLDPKLIRHILQQDFEYFTDRGFYHNEKDDPLSANLLTVSGQRWRNLRTKLSPAFTSAKVKIAFPPLIQCANQMKNAIDTCCLRKQPIQTKEIMACYTTDVIGSCAFGIDCNSFENPNSLFRQYGDRAFNFSSKMRIFKGLVGACYPNLARWLGLTIFDKDLSNFFINVVKDTVKYRKSNNIIRKDMLQILMELETDIASDCIDEKKIEKASIELAGDVFFFFLAGFETSSSTLTCCLYELACNPPIQNKLRDEIITVLSEHEEELTHEAIMEMKYLSQVVDETLRKYPTSVLLTRKCEKNYHVPDTNLTLEKGTLVAVSVLGLHHDPEYYPDPDIFDPERFSEEGKRNRIPFTYMPFGEGPRICIGLRFALMQVKVAIITLLKNYKFSLNEETNVPMQYEDFAVVLTPKSQVPLNAEKLHDE